MGLKDLAHYQIPTVRHLRLAKPENTSACPAQPPTGISLWALQNVIGIFLIVDISGLVG